MLTVCVITYNHEKFISQCLKSIFDQKTKFDFQVIILDDASTDNTSLIISDLIKILPENIEVDFIVHDQNKGVSSNFLLALSKANTGYVAFCEGDDYWTHTYKLQKQHDFLESNKHFTFCTHRTILFDEELNDKIDEKLFFFPKKVHEEFVYDFKCFEEGRHAGLQSIFFRKSNNLIEELEKYNYLGDIHLLAELLNQGNGYSMDFEGAVYRVHYGGTFSKRDSNYRARMNYLIYNEIFSFNPGNNYIKNRYEFLAMEYLKCLISNHKYYDSLLLGFSYFSKASTIRSLKSIASVIYKNFSR